MIDKIYDEDLKKAKGIKHRKGETNSALAERDYSVRCEILHVITIVQGYWIWWCSAHHQPAFKCEIDKLKGFKNEQRN